MEEKELRISEGGETGTESVVTLEGNFYSCKHCGTHLALSEDIVSKSFYCSNGKAYLFNNADNVTLGPKEERLTISGLYIVVDIFCIRCGTILGWKYETSHEKSQKYKEGKPVLERIKISSPDGGSDGDDA